MHDTSRGRTGTGPDPPLLGNVMHMTSAALMRARTLPADQLLRLSTALGRASATRGFPSTDDPELFLAECDSRSIDHLTVVSTFARENPDDEAVSILSTLIGHQVTQHRFGTPLPADYGGGRPRSRTRGARQTVRQRHSKESPLLSQIIRILVTENPKRGMAARRFALYTDGMIVQNYILAGGRIDDVRWDMSHNFIRLERGRY